MDGGAPAAPDMTGGADMGGQDPNGGGMAPPADDGMGGNMPPMDNGMGMPPAGDEGNGDEDVLNVDDLTNAQEKMNNKVNIIGKGLGKTDQRISDLLNAVESMKQIIDNNNREIAGLKQDIIKRNPTPTEKLYLRSLDSYPYNTDISDYWKRFIKSGKDNYDIMVGGDYNDRPDYGGGMAPEKGNDEDKEYEITVGDLNHASDNDLYDSFDDDDDEDQNTPNFFKPKRRF
jgi:hypothetical protein